MSEAFDQPGRDPPHNSAGWWRLIRNRNGGGGEIGEDYRFLDKTEAAEREKEKRRDRSPRDPENEGYSDLVAISVMAALLVVGMSTSGMFFMWRKLLRVRWQSRQQSALTKEEIRRFFEGYQMSQRAPQGDYQEGSEVVGDLSLTAYDTKYELPPHSFSVDEDSPLGSGAFGMVCRGTVIKPGQGSEVAVKMLKEDSPASALKGLLSEIKVMSHLGEHENLVSLVGAYTKELERGKVYVFTELCGMGSLEKFLREMEPLKLEGEEDATGQEESEQNAKAIFVRKNGTGQLDSDQLYRCSYQIACGMEYLASKHVVHADLATRNVLLTSKMTAKVSDFGLSRRLYDYTNYVKSQQEPLPWRWMAPESLRRFEFNEKTDVWAYGVTLWEIYSLGDIPYPGLSWTLDFPISLTNGLRLTEPEHNADEMYISMLKCWNVDPAKRPKFLELKESLEKEWDVKL